MAEAVAVSNAGPDPAVAGHIMPANGEEFRFRRCRLLPGARLLLKDGLPIPIGSRAFDILHILLRSRGTIVPKNEIVDAVWPTTFVEESNLRFQVAQLRKALGCDGELIKTIPGRGYLLAWDCATTEADRHPSAEAEGGLESGDRSADATDKGKAVILSRIGSEDPAARRHLEAFLESCGVRNASSVLLYVTLNT